MASVTFNVPLDAADKVAAFLRTLNLNQGESSSSAASSSTAAPVQRMEIVPVQVPTVMKAYAIESIDAHRNYGGNDFDYEYLIQWVGYTERSWVREADILCPETLREYWLSKGIKNTIYILIRVSTPGQADPNTVSLDAQKQECTRYLASKKCDGFRIVVITAIGSGYKSIPKTFREAANFAASGDMFVCYRIDRLTRSLSLSVPWLTDLHHRGVRIHSVVEDVDFAPGNIRFTEGIVAAQREAEILGARIRTSIQARRDRGDTCLGSAPYGKYKIRDPVTGAITLADNVQEKEIILRIRSYSPSVTSRVIADQLNEAGIRNRKNRAWTRSSICSIRRDRS